MDPIEKAIIGVLRRIAYLNVHRKRVVAEARVERGKYRCAKCEGLFKREEVHMDHIKPVVNPLTGFDGNWNGYIKELFYGELQALCVPCHKEKTKTENIIRKETKQWQKLK